MKTILDRSSRLLSLSALRRKPNAPSAVATWRLTHASALLPCLIVSTLSISAEPQTNIKIQYREIIDGSIYGHSGRPAREVLNQLKELTPRGMAEAKVNKELAADSKRLEEKLEDNLEKTEDKKERNKLEEEYYAARKALFDPKKMEKKVTDCLNENLELLERIETLAKPRAKPLIADIEPVCEPAAVILNDALAQEDSATLNLDLVELGAFYPPGSAEPAWADLVRTRKYVVYTDGGSYCRLFLPGTSGEEAWQAAYPVVRHVLRSLLKEDRALKVDVYSYENDIPSTTFTLNSQKHFREVKAADLCTSAELMALDLKALEAFFAEGLTLKGCTLDVNGQLVLIGEKGPRKPTLEGHPVELSDLAVAYRASAYAGHGESYMSLDPAPDKDRVNVNFGGRLYDTRMGWVAYRCDLRFKSLGNDFDAVTFESQTQNIKTSMPDFATVRSRMCSNVDFRNLSEEQTRFWFYPDDFKIVTSHEGTSCLVTHPRFKAAAERQDAKDGSGKKLAPVTPPWTAQTLEHFNKNYPEFAKLYTEVAELDDAARLLGVAEFLHEARNKGTLKLDLDQLLGVELPASPIPRSREQFIVEYVIKKKGMPAEFKSYCRASLQGAEAFEKAFETLGKKDSEWNFMTSIGGGLDFSARPAVQKSTAANAAQEGALTAAKTNVEIPGPEGQALKSSKAHESPGGGMGKGPPETPAKGGFISGDSPDPQGVKLYFREDKGTKIRREQASRQSRISDENVSCQGKGLHSVWTGEHGLEGFEVRISEGLVPVVMKKGPDNVFHATRVWNKRAPSSAEVEALSTILAREKSSLAEVWSNVRGDIEIVALDHTPDGESIICFRDKGAIVSKICGKDGVIKELRGEDAIEALHASSRAKVGKFSVPGKVELLHVSETGDSEVVVQIGRRKPVKLASEEWTGWLLKEKGARVPKYLDAIITELQKSNAELVVMRDALQSKPAKFQPAGKSPRTLLEETRKATVDGEESALTLSSNELKALISEFKEQAEKATGLEAVMAKSELAQLEDIQGMTAKEKAVEIAALKTQNKERLTDIAVRVSTSDAVTLTGLLKERLPKLRVSYDDPSELVARRVDAEPVVRNASEVGLVIPPDEAGVDDKGMLKKLEDFFQQSGVTAIREGADLKKVGSVIVITAHNNRALFDYVQWLGDHQIEGKSALDGKILMLTTCFEEGNPNMVSELLKRYNCAGVHVQSERVHKDAVRQALAEFAKMLRDLKTKPDQPARRLRDLYDAAVLKVIETCPKNSPLKGELEKLLRARVQWCAVPTAPHGLHPDAASNLT